MNEEWRALNDRMVDALFRPPHIASPRIEEAFRAVPRHLFLPGTPLAEVYSGKAVVTQTDADGNPTSSSSEPGVMLTMLEQLQPQPGQRVLEIGAGTGYNAALIAHLVGDTGAVTTVDIDEEVARRARENLAGAGFEVVQVHGRDGWSGAAERAPLDAIEATVGVWDLSPHWVEQLREDGLLLVPLRLRGWAQALVCFRKEGTRLVSTSFRGGGFMPFRGPHADPDGPLEVDGFRVRFTEPRPEDEVALLRELLAREPASEIAEDVSWWGLSYKLSLWVPDAISIQQGQRTMLGIFDARERSVALFEPDFQTGGGATSRGWLRIFGDTTPLERLRGILARMPHADAQGAPPSVVAVPTSLPPPEGTLFLRRRHYQFALNWQRDD